MDAVSLRRVGTRDWRALRAIRLRALRDAPDAFGSTYEHESTFTDDEWRGWARDAANGRTETCLLAWSDREPIGIVGAFVEEAADHAHLIAMWVAPAARRRGVGKRLVAGIASWARAASLGSVRLDVAADNVGAISLYEGCGFAPTGRSRRYDDRPALTTVELQRSLQ